MSERYQKSEEYLQRALKTIPLGSQTFSKSKTQYPYGVSPYFIQKGLGSHVWDIDGNEYIDFVNSLASITLGYNDPDVTDAVKKQLEEGVVFSLSHPIEAQVAEKIVDMVPCAEKVRFGKNGSDATAGAIRVARAYTGRDHVLTCGYHGWQDWYIGSTSRNKGVPEAVRNLTHTFEYNNIESLHRRFKEYPSQVAAVILEPMNTTYPLPGFLESVKELTHQNGAILIFDETITGFRFSNGGAQELFGVTPDLATFGKGLANGYPLSAVAGKAGIMKEMEEVFFSFTFGGETLSLAAANAVLTKLKTKPILKTLGSQGEKILTGIQELIEKIGLQDVLYLSGHPTWSFLNFTEGKYKSFEIKTLFLQEVFRRGILTLGMHNMSFSHSEQDIRCLLNVYSEVFPIIQLAVQNEDLRQRLSCEVLMPLFKVR